MKKLILVFIITLSFVTPQKSQAALMDAKGKAFLIICTYGTVGGALLGFASLAFGANSRAIAQGASLGLYAGIGFGSYVIASHGQANQEEYIDPAYQQPQAPPPGFGQPSGFGQPQGGYGDPNSGYGPPPGQDPSGFGAPPAQEDDGNSGGFFGQRVQEINDDLFYNYRIDENKKGRGFNLPIYVPLMHYQF